MSRAPNLRQIEAFKAIVEAGTVSRAAELLRISQPAASKLIAHLEADTGMELFERERGRLRPNARGLRLYEEVDRIFAGLQQIERTLETIRREERDHLAIGVIPALSGSFICQVVGRFLRSYPDVHVSLDTGGSRVISEWLNTRQLDIGIIAPGVSSAHLKRESLFESPMVCIMPPDHHLAKRPHVGVHDLVDEKFVGLDASTHTRRLIDGIFEAYGASLKVTLEATTAPDICALVAEGLGVSLLHPLLASSVRGRVAVRPFLPSTPLDFEFCWPINGRNKQLVEAFWKKARTTAEEVVRQLMREA